MATSKTAKPAKAIKAANDNALKGYPKAKMLQAFNKIGAAKDAEDTSAEDRASAAMDIVELAVAFRTSNADATLETVVAGWRDNVRLTAMQLAVAGNRFAKVTPGKDGQPDKATLTGYGNNVASIAKGALEFELTADDMVDDEGIRSFRATRRAVEARRAEARRLADPDAAAFADEMAAADEAWRDLRSLIAESGKLGNAKALRQTLEGHAADIREQLIAASDAAEQAAAEAA